MTRKVSLGQYLSYTPRDHDFSEPVGWISGHEKIEPVIQVKTTYYSEQFGIEIQVKSMMNDGSLSRIMISGGTNTCVEDVCEEKRSSYDEEMASGTGIGKPIATEQKGQSSPASNLPSQMFIPVDQRKWNDIPVANDVMKGSLLGESRGL